MAAWLLVKVVLTLAALYWLMLQQRDAWKTQPPGAVPILALLASATPIVADLMHGNINLWILFLVVAAWRAFATGWKLLAGVVLGLAVACKVTPALLVLYFAWKREWTTTAAVVVGLAFWLFVAPAAYFGRERNLYLLDRWSGLMLKPYLSEGRAERDVRNQSLAGLYQRLTAPPRTERSIDAAEDEPLHTDPPINFASLDPATSRWLWRALAGAAVVGLWWVSRSPTASTDRRWLEHELALVLLAMLLLSERSWKHHYVTILPSFVALISWIAQRRGAAARPVVVALTAVAAILPIVASQDLLGPLAGDAVVDRLQAYGVYIWSAALLIAAHLIARRDLNAQSRRSTP